MTGRTDGMLPSAFCYNTAQHGIPERTQTLRPYGPYFSDISKPYGRHAAVRLTLH
jgi:hypothetical protein